MSAEEKWQAFGASMGDVIQYIVIYFIVLGGAFLATIVVALLYAERKANGIDPKTNKANTGWRIAITILLIVCLVLLLPLAYLSVFV